jgi:hypothetical protein
VPAGCREGWDPLGVGGDEPDVPVVGGGAGVLELVDVGGDGELRVGDGVLTGGVLTDGVLTDGALTDGALTDGVLTDGTLVDGTLTEGSGDDEESAGGTAIAIIAPTRPAPTDATNRFLPLDTG